MDGALNRYLEIARFYDVEHECYDDREGPRGDVAYYRRLADEVAPARVLDLGCGTGRIALPLSAAGHHVVGVDDSPAMLAQLRAKPDAGPVLTHRHDIFHPYDLGHRFDLVLLAYNVLQAAQTLHRAVTALSIAAAHLAEGGRLAMSLPTPIPPDQLWREEDREIWSVQDSRHDIHLHARRRILEADQRRRLLIYEEQVTMRNAGVETVHRDRFTLRYFTPEEVRQLFEDAGLELLHQQRGYGRESDPTADEEVFVLCQI